MHAGRHYSLKEVVVWTRRETLLFAVIAFVPMALSALGVDLPPIPWQPVAVLGTAVAFVTGFKSNAAYGRLWEARKIWGGIINTSRAFAVQSRDFLDVALEPECTQRFIHRHIAWLTALRHQLRQPRGWETAHSKANAEYRNNVYSVPEDGLDIDRELEALLSPEDWQDIRDKRGRTSALLAQHSADLRRMADDGALTEYRHVALAQFVTDFYELQGKCERIKNFPYPRQFATLNHMFVWLFIAVLPFAIASEMQKIGAAWVWLTVPMTVLVAWVFHTMDKIGSVSENPFEGNANDVPITAMSRTIEIDLRELLGEQQLPEALQPVRNILM